MKRFLTPLLLGGLVLLFALLEPTFFTWSNFMNVLRQVSPLAIAALGQALVILVGGIDISVGSNLALGSVVAGLVALRLGTAPAFVLALAAGAMAGLISGVAVTRFRVQPVIATIGMLSLSRGLAFLISDGNPVVGLPDSFAWLGNSFVATIPMAFGLCALTFLLVWGWLTFTPSGRALFAIGGGEDAARLAGIPVSFYKPLAYLLSGLLSAVAALVITSWQGSGQPTLGYGWELQTIAAVVLGGTALGGGRINVAGTLVGALTTGVLSNGMDLTNVSPYLQEVVLGFAIVAVVLADRVRQRTRHDRLA